MNGDFIVLRKATINDLAGILALLSTKEASDFKGLISLPDVFQKQAVQLEIEKGRLFVAVNKNDGSIIAQRKFFIIEDSYEQYDILTNLLRCTHRSHDLIEYGFINHRLEFSRETGKHFIPHQKILYLYTGAAYTHPLYRGRRINEHLRIYAYEYLKDLVIHKVRTCGYTSLALTYLLAHENNWRTAFAVRSYFPFIQSMSNALGLPPAEEISFYAYDTVKPEFTISPEGNLVQLPDEQCRPGRGCILLYELAGNQKK